MSSIKEFMSWTAGYDGGSAEGTNTLPSHENFLKKVNCPVLKIEHPLSTPEQINLIMNLFNREH